MQCIVFIERRRQQQPLAKSKDLEKITEECIISRPSWYVRIAPVDFFIRDQRLMTCCEQNYRQGSYQSSLELYNELLETAEPVRSRIACVSPFTDCLPSNRKNILTF